MNRLWVRISQLTILVVLIVALSPFAQLWLSAYFEFVPNPIQNYRPPYLPPNVQSEQMAQYQERLDRVEREREQRLWFYMLRIVVVGSLGGIIVGVWFGRKLAKPLSTLQRSAQAIAAHEFSHRVPIEGTQEMQLLAQSFNQMAAELERSQRLRHNLLADVAHELRHPLHVIQGSLRAILDGVYALEMEEIARLSNQTRLLTTLVNDLHELAQAEAHELALHKQLTDINRLLKESSEWFHPLAASKKITLTTHIPSQPLTLNVDKARLRQALNNLLSNALRHTPEGGQITLRLAKAGEHVEITVLDTGEGISAENLPHIFDRFYRVRADRSRQDSGTGLGLAITQAIIQAHGGKIEATSLGKKQGSQFTITLLRNSD